MYGWIRCHSNRFYMRRLFVRRFFFFHHYVQQKKKRERGGKEIKLLLVSVPFLAFVRVKVVQCISQTISKFFFSFYKNIFQDFCGICNRVIRFDDRSHFVGWLILPDPVDVTLYWIHRTNMEQMWAEMHIHTKKK